MYLLRNYYISKLMFKNNEKMNRKLLKLKKVRFREYWRHLGKNRVSLCIKDDMIVKIFTEYIIWAKMTQKKLQSRKKKLLNNEPSQNVQLIFLKSSWGS